MADFADEMSMPYGAKAKGGSLVILSRGLILSSKIVVMPVFKGASLLRIIAVGSGGGGGGVYGAGSGASSAGGGGGGGEFELPYSPGLAISCSIGAGGAAVGYDASAGNDGADTTAVIAGAVVCSGKGGKAGAQSGVVRITGGAGGGWTGIRGRSGGAGGGCGTPSYLYGSLGSDCGISAGGQAISDASSGGVIAGGGASPVAPGRAYGDATIGVGAGGAGAINSNGQYYGYTGGGAGGVLFEVLGT